MKTLKLMSLLLAALLLTANLFAQEEMTYEEWQNEINRLTQQKAELTKELNALQSDVNSLKAKYEGKKLNNKFE